MYESFRVQNFRGFEDLRLDDLARVNLIAGKNNTGKTALLEAIALHTGMYDPDTLLRMNIRDLRDFRRHSGSDIGLPEWDIIFNQFDTGKEITLSGVLEQVARQMMLLKNVDILRISKVGISEITMSGLLECMKDWTSR